MDVKKCTECHDTKPVREFRTVLDKRRGKTYVQPTCKDCRRKLDRRGKRRHDLQRRYGISPEEYEQMFKAQRGKCCLCGYSHPHRPLHVDHNHTTGKTRALLCNWCNTAIGYAREDVEILKKMIRYLKTHGEKK